MQRASVELQYGLFVVYVRVCVGGGVGEYTHTKWRCHRLKQLEVQFLGSGFFIQALPLLWHVLTLRRKVHLRLDSNTIEHV